MMAKPVVDGVLQVLLGSKVPKPTHIGKFVSVSKALGGKYPKNVANHERTIQSETVVERLKYIGAGQNAWNAPIPKRLQLKVNASCF